MLEDQLVRISIEAVFEEAQACWQLPLWRPGRYEIQTFPQNIQDFKVLNTMGEELSWEKVSSHVWSVKGTPGDSYRIEYSYFANQLDAGGSYVLDDLIYINGINLFMYQTGKESDPCELNIHLPSGFAIGGNSYTDTKRTFINFHELVDAPFIASKALVDYTFDVDGLEFCISIYGGRLPDLSTFEKEMTALIKEQVQLFGRLPISTYTLWLIFTPYRFRHGVEHLDSTVITIGPDYSLWERDRYLSFLEICCHELFHVWNVKSFRPYELTPYDYAVPQYTKLHFVTEGCTTYFGCYLLYRAGLCTFEEWVNLLNEELVKFALSGGGDYISLTQASTDSWVNGYHSKGAPNRRISFYTKGHLVALLMDFYIRKYTGDQNKLEELMVALWNVVIKEGRGYTEEDFKAFLFGYAEGGFEQFYLDYIEGTTSLLPALGEFGNSLGMTLVAKPYPTVSESLLGIQVSGTSMGGVKIVNFLPQLKETYGLMRGDQIIAIGEQQVDKNWRELLLQWRGKPQVQVDFFRMGRIRRVAINVPASFKFFYPQFAFSVGPTERQLTTRKLWKES